MIIPNGTIQLKQKTQAGLNGINPTTGYAVKPAGVKWGEPIPCQYLINRYSAIARAQGEPVTLSSYDVLIEAQPFPLGIVKLTDDATKKEVGEFSIIKVEQLTAVGQTRLLI